MYWLRIYFAISALIFSHFRPLQLGGERQRAEPREQEEQPRARTRRYRTEKARKKYRHPTGQRAHHILRASTKNQRTQARTHLIYPRLRKSIKNQIIFFRWRFFAPKSQKNRVSHLCHILVVSAISTNSLTLNLSQNPVKFNVKVRFKLIIIKFAVFENCKENLHCHISVWGEIRLLEQFFRYHPREFFAKRANWRGRGASETLQCLHTYLYMYGKY